MDIGRAFVHAFEDKNWPGKIAIGGLLMLVIPLLPVFPLGYVVRHMINLLEGRDTPLPEWNDWSGDLTRGLSVAAALIIYLIPGWIVETISVSLLRSGSVFVNLIGAWFLCLLVLYAIAFIVFWPALFIRYVHTGQFNGFFQFSEAWRFIHGNLADYIVAVLMSIAAVIVALILGGIILVVGVLFTTFIALLVSAHLMAQVARRAQEDSTTATTA